MYKLEQFFKKPLYKNALTSYERGAKGRNWRIVDKFKMYNWAKQAFESDLAEEKRRQSFNQIYEELRRYWQVFRNARKGHWSSSEIFDALTQQCAACSRGTNLTLITINPNTTESKEILKSLNSLYNLKPVSVYPWMAVSKFTHFFNPKLFPLYDYTIVWTKVLNGAFKNDYRKWCQRHNHNPNNAAAEFNLYYTLWAGHVIRNADSDMMDYFMEWFGKQVGRDIFKQGLLNDISQYYSTAFEFISIGAAELIGQ